MNRLVENEMEKINIKAVKEIYKNAKIISLQGGQRFKIPTKYSFHYDNESNAVYLEHSWDIEDGSKGYVLLKCDSYQAEILEEFKADLNTPKHYDNTNGTLYKIAEERGWNSYLFDIVKRLERAEKKGEFTQDLEKSINVIKLWQNER